MTLDTLISDLHSHREKYPLEAHACHVTTGWIQSHKEFAFVKDNLEGHVVASLLVMNPSRTRVLLMLHKKFNRWQQFGGHCDGEIDVYNVALREFHEESGIQIDPENIWLLYVDEQFIPENKWRPEHIHYDIWFLWILDDSHFGQYAEDQALGMEWIDIKNIREYNDEDRMSRWIERAITI